ncbi:MAG: pyruvate kinase [Anaerolineaceae bacterium]|nr:pyruvate kinase [Anaerolineaceae bacterium]
MERKAKIIATIGPASQDEGVLHKMILAGMDIARFNFSHGTHEDHQQRLLAIRQLSDSLGKPVSILQDLQGPKLRVGALPRAGIPLVGGNIISLVTPENLPGKLSQIVSIPVDIPDLAQTVQPRNHILMDDGKIEVVVTEVAENSLRARVLVGGVLKSFKGVNLPGTDLKIPSLTSKDLNDLRFGLEIGVDMIAVSFVRKAQDILQVRKNIQQTHPHMSTIPIIAKLEKPEAIKNLDEIIEVSDGVMIARGDLAVETSPESVPVLQKQIIKAANHSIKTVITATQMLESMITNPRPTRAEASDVANAIFDGSDAAMLSAETAVGQYPIESIAMMERIILQAESRFGEWGTCRFKEAATADDAISITRAARELAHDRNVAAIAVFTQSGRTALLMSKARPQVPILAFTPDRTTYQKLNLFWGITPFLVPFSNTIEMALENVGKMIASSTKIQSGQQVVVVSSFPLTDERQPPNFALLHTIGAPENTYKI